MPETLLDPGAVLHHSKGGRQALAQKALAAKSFPNPKDAQDSDEPCGIAVTCNPDSYSTLAN